MDDHPPIPRPLDYCRRDGIHVAFSMGRDASGSGVVRGGADGEVEGGTQEPSSAGGTGIGEICPSYWWGVGEYDGGYASEGVASQLPSFRYPLPSFRYPPMSQAPPLQGPQSPHGMPSPQGIPSPQGTPSQHSQPPHMPQPSPIISIGTMYAATTGRPL